MCIRDSCYCNALFTVAFFSVSWCSCSVFWEQPLVLYLGYLAVLSSYKHHWLSYPRRVLYKFVLTYKYLLSWMPEYYSWLCMPTASVSGRPWLRSADDNERLMSRTQSDLVPKHSPHRDQMFGTLYLCCIIHLCCWTVSNVYCTVCRRGFLVATGAFDDFRQLCIFKCHFIIIIITISNSARNCSQQFCGKYV